MKIDQFMILLILAVFAELLYQKYFLAIILLVFGGILLFRNYTVAKDFKCARCGKCCRFKVEPSEEDIKRIKKAGKKDFMQGKFLKRAKEDKKCIFLTSKKGVVKCSIYKNRPEICRKWPNSKGIFGKQVDPRCHQFLKIR
ncbi:MAG: YkgJ family cysteine cluster protein [Nanoarchaeota archaeon]|nr:YkgJ family cysteine cluster protein [Nanoarchaeota archaeon]